LEREHLIETVGKKLRKMCGLQKED